MAPKNENLSHADLLVLQKQNKVLQNDHKREQNVENELSECTFQPKIIKYKHSGSKVNKSVRMPSPRGDNENQFDSRISTKQNNSKISNRHLELYNQAKPRCQQRDKKTEELEYERNCDECTFSPDLAMTKNFRDNTPNVSQIKNSDSTIFRLRKGWEEQKEKKKFLERGYHDIKKKNQKDNMEHDINEQRETLQSEKPVMKSPQPQNNHDYYNQDYQDISPQKQFGQPQKQENRQPMLFVDVNLAANKMERITVYEGDDSQSLADNFIREQNLDPFIRPKLIELLQAQINSVVNY